MACSDSKRCIWPLLGCALLMIWLPSAARAEVQPGDMITPENASKVRDLVSPGVYYKIVRGMTLRIVPTNRVDYPPPYLEATEKYSDQVRLSPDGRSLENYVAGQPFPFLDSNDPHVAIKIIWNNVFGPIMSDDYDLRYYSVENVRESRGGTYRVLDEENVGHYAGYNEVGRTEVEPLPVDPDFNVTGRYWLFGLYPVMAPENLRGDGFIRFRYADPNKGDDIWKWSPGARRLRRVNEGIMSDAVTGAGLPGAGGGNIIVFDPDHYSGFNAKVEEYDYRFLGEKTMLGCVHAVHSPEVTCLTDGGASACPEDWELRKLYIIEATPRRALASEDLHSRTILYIDSEAWFPLYEDEYDAEGRLWQNHTYWLSYRDRPVPDARVAIYPFKRLFVVGAAATDEQTGMAAMAYLPGKHTPERECWYINMGAVDKSFFTTASLTKAAR